MLKKNLKKITLTGLVLPAIFMLGACASQQQAEPMAAQSNQAYTAIGEAPEGRVVRLSDDLKQEKGVWVRDEHTTKLYPVKNIGGDTWVLTEEGLMQYAQDMQAASGS